MRKITSVGMLRCYRHPDMEPIPKGEEMYLNKHGVAFHIGCNPSDGIKEPPGALFQ